MRLSRRQALRVSAVTDHAAFGIAIVGADTFDRVHHHADGEILDPLVARNAAFLGGKRRIDPFGDILGSRNRGCTDEQCNEGYDACHLGAPSARMDRFLASLASVPGAPP